VSVQAAQEPPPPPSEGFAAAERFIENGAAELLADVVADELAAFGLRERERFALLDRHAGLAAKLRVAPEPQPPAAARRTGGTGEAAHPSSGRPSSPQAPPQNPEAEESILGAMMLAREAIAAVRGEVDASDFYRESHARIYQAALDLHDRGEAVDAITLADFLEERGQLDDVGGRVRIHELAAIVPATGNAAHWARIVTDAATLRGLIRAGGEIARLGWERPGDIAELAGRAQAQVNAVAERAAPRGRFAGLTHEELLSVEFQTAPELIADLADAGALGTIAALPEHFKTFLAIEAACKVAAGGLVLDRFSVNHTGPVGFWFQDDAPDKANARVRAYTGRHNYPPDLPIRWHLGEGLRLPDGIPALRAEIEREGQVLVVLDSLYNFLPAGMKLKEEDVAAVLSALKSDVCDATGCAICLIDHAPWPTEANRGLRRGYGSVFKAAAIRWGVYIERQGERLYIEGRGNNVRGLPRSLVTWDADVLQLRLIDTDDDHASHVADRADRALAWLNDNPGSHSTSKIRKALGGRESITDEALETLKARAEVQDHGRDGGPWSGRGGDARYWIASNHAASHGTQTSAQVDGPRSAEVGTGASEYNPRPAPRRGAEVERAEVDVGGKDAVPEELEWH
jgi:DnaB-like helicase N terminal domain/AAA domain